MSIGEYDQVVAGQFVPMSARRPYGVWTPQRILATRDWLYVKWITAGPHSAEVVKILPGWNRAEVMLVHHAVYEL